MKRILAAPEPGVALALMARLGVLAAVVPEGAEPARVAGLPPDPVLRMAALLTGDPVAFAARLKLSTAEAERLAALRGPPPEGSDDDLRRALADTPLDVLEGRSWLAGQARRCGARLAALPRPVFPLEGRMWWRWASRRVRGWARCCGRCGAGGWRADAWPARRIAVPNWRGWRRPDTAGPHGCTDSPPDR